MEALSQIADTPGLMLVTAGLAEIAAPPGVAHRHMGAIADEPTMARIYNAADVVAIPSIEDNLPNTMLEALACGVPVAGFETGGVGETIQAGRTGLLAEPGDAYGLGRAIADLLADDSARRELAENCRQTAERQFSQSASAGAYMQLYRRLLGHDTEGPASTDGLVR